MIIAFANATDRTDPSQAARLCAHAFQAAGLDVTLVRACPGAAKTDPYAAGLRVVALTAGALPVAAALTAAVSGAGVVVADLPFEFLIDRRIRDVVDIPVLAVGPYASDERAAHARLDRLRRPRRDDPARPGPAPADRMPWLLGCRRGGGGPAASAFATAIADASTPGAATACRILPVAIGPLTRAEDRALEAGNPTRRNLRDATVLALALRMVSADPSASRVDHPGLDAANERERIAMTSDERSLPERLHGLADDIDAILQAGGPSEAELADAPILDHWIRDVVPTPVLKGFVSNHPGIATGRPVRTSEVFVTDNATYARTLSRLYALRMPGPPGEPLRLQ